MRFSALPLFEYNRLEDIGHEAIDTHKASLTIRYNHISRARTGVVINFHAGTLVVFENNTVRDCGARFKYRKTLG